MNNSFKRNNASNKGFKKTTFKKPADTNQDSERSSSKKPSFDSDSKKKDKKKTGFERYRDESKPSDFSGQKRKKTSDSSSPDRKFKPKGDSAYKKTWGPKKNKPAAEFFDSESNETNKAPKTAKPSFKKGADKKDEDGLIRLNKYIANAGICSRREADELISTGVVQVNGKTITEMGYKVKPTDIVKYGGQTLKKERLVYLILNKPKDYITTVDDPQERRTVLELIQDACRERIYPVGRLDRATTGLLMFTNDGELTKRLTHPRYGVRKIYHVSLDKPLKRADLDKIAEGIELEDGPIKVDEINYVGDGSDKAEIGIELHSGKNRIVRRIFEFAGYNVRKLDRVMFGPLSKKDLPRGRWRFLTEAEIGMLKMVSTGR